MYLLNPRSRRRVLGSPGGYTSIAAGFLTELSEQGPDFLGSTPRSFKPAYPGKRLRESFNGCFRDDFLATERFDTLLEARVLAEDWRIEYNTVSPHGALGA
jgi:transposase InsO family protein